MDSSGLQNLHAPLDAAGDGLYLVFCEIVPGFRTEDGEDGRQMLCCVNPRAVVIFAVGNQCLMIAILNQLGRHLLDVHDEVYKTRCSGALWHPGHGMMVKLSLRDCKPTAFFYGRNPGRPVASDARQDD